MKRILLFLSVLAFFACSPKAVEKPSFLWIDASANFNSNANDADSIAWDSLR